MIDVTRRIVAHLIKRSFRVSVYPHALKIYNLKGHVTETLVNNFQTAREHQVIWTTEGLSSGIYFYRLQAGEFSETKKLILQT